nr:uncharacterized protein LOC109752201 isoform X2 [Aegilops tauschii subsp. strangulata]
MDSVSPAARVAYFAPDLTPAASIRSLPSHQAPPSPARVPVARLCFPCSRSMRLAHVDPPCLADPLARQLQRPCPGPQARSSPGTGLLQPLHRSGLGPCSRFRSEVVRIRSTSSVCLFHGLYLLPSGISGADDTSAGDATELKWEFDEDLGHSFVSFPDD